MEREVLSPALWLFAESLDVTSRTEFRGHVTVAAAVVCGEQVLHIEHRASGLSLLPGGHLEPVDRTLTGAVLRKLREETGLGGDAVAFLRGTPVHIDIHTVAERPSKSEPAHPHFDFRYLLKSNTMTLDLQSEDVLSAEWKHVTSMPDKDLRARILHAL